MRCRGGGEGVGCWGEVGNVGNCVERGGEFLGIPYTWIVRFLFCNLKVRFLSSRYLWICKHYFHIFIFFGPLMDIGSRTYNKAILILCAMRCLLGIPVIFGFITVSNPYTIAMIDTRFHGRLFVMNKFNSHDRRVGAHGCGLQSKEN